MHYTKLVMISACLYSVTPTSFSATEATTLQTSESITTCSDGTPPTVVKNLPDLIIPLNQTSQVSAAQSFNGDHIFYSVSALVTNKTNKVMINRRNGLVVIQAAAVDEFPVSVEATNPCGKATIRFSVKISEQN